jgi:hypothetical protein
MTRDGKFWISPGARLWLMALTCIFALSVVFVVIPASQTRHRQDRLLAERALQARQGDAVLHRFDCTYGAGTRLMLAEAIRAAHVASHTALVSRHAQLEAGNKKAANAALRARRSNKTAEARYRAILKNLKPFDPTPTRC